MELAIETINLTKNYGSKKGCEDVCLRVYRGQTFGFLGHNGAGKSTLVKMLVGLLHPSSGSALLLGRPLGDRESKKKISFLPENFRYHDWLTLRQLLEFHAGLYGMKKNECSERLAIVVETVGLKGREHQKIRTFSKGMQQRAGLACAMLPDPELLFLDEPTSALDPLGRMEVRKILLHLKELGKTVFLNSHLLSEVEKVCDTVAFIKAGRVIHQEDVKDPGSKKNKLVVTADGIDENIIQAISTIAHSVKFDGGSIIIELDSRQQAPAIAEAVIRGGGKLHEMYKRTSTLEEMFIQVTSGVDH